MNRKAKPCVLVTVVLLTALFALIQPTSGGQWTTIPGISEPVIGQDGICTDAFKPTDIQKRAGHYTKKDWRRIIDSLWGPGLPTPEKLMIFDRVWTVVDSNFACFNNLVVNWDSLRTVYRAEIESTVSRGRFAAIMNHLALALKEGHTKVVDLQVNSGTYPNAGVPLFVYGGWGDNHHFGAGLTPLSDSSLLVYKVWASHPLNLQRGDIVLGYDCRPWKTLYKELMTYQLPLASWSYHGSSDTTLTHAFLISAGLNWHLFDTIDVVKYSTGDTVHLPTSLLIGPSWPLYCTEQMDIPGVPMPNIASGQYISYGVWNGTQIGYLYGWVWTGNAETQFYNALDSLTNSPSLKGLIIDFRYNRGGNMFLSNRGLQLLFKDSTYTIAFGARRDPRDHRAMRVVDGADYYIIPGNCVQWYNKPIAVLTGPGCISSGDQVAFRMKFHPRVRIFGKSTSTAFNGPEVVSIHPDWLFSYAREDACLASDTTFYLTHLNMTHEDVPLWLTTDDVARGDDTVAKRAKDWIDSVTAIAEDPARGPVSCGHMKLRVCPNPVRGVATIELVVAGASSVSTSVFNSAGQNVARLTSGKIAAGIHLLRWRTSALPGGVYFCRATSGSLTSVAKIVVVK